MPKRIPIKVARDVGKQTGCRQIILLAFDGELTLVTVLDGLAPSDHMAARGGNLLKEKWGWHNCILPSCTGDCVLHRCVCGRIWAHFCDEDEGCEWQETNEMQEANV
jgi:hypothetical protein